MAFNSLMPLVLQELQVRLDQHAQHAPLQAAFASLGLRAIPVAWVDDLAVPVVALQASTLQPVMQWTLRTLIDVCASFGLELNLKPRKTEVVPAFRGPEAPACRHACFIVNFPGISVPDTDQSVRCVPTYEHLGTCFQSDGGIDAEIRHRVRKASLAFKQIHRVILKNRHLAVPLRLRLLDALVMPVLLHGAGNWPILTTSQLQKLHGRYMRWVRSIVGNGFWADDQLTDIQLQLQWLLPSIAMRLAKHRLLFAFHLFADAPGLIIEVVTATADSPRSWIQALRKALTWALSVDASLLQHDPLPTSLADLIQWFVAHRVDGPRRVRRIYRRALHHGLVIGEAWAAHQALLRQLQRGGVTFDVPLLEEAALPLQHECRWCAKTFSTLRQWQNHLWSAHGEPSDEHLYMTTTVCPACWTCYWMANRLQIHLRHSQRQRHGCYERLTWLHEPLENPVSIEDVNGDACHARLPATAVPHVRSRHEVGCLSCDDADHRLNQACRVERFVVPNDVAGVQGCKLAFDAVLRDQSLLRTANPDAILWRLQSC